MIVLMVMVNDYDLSWLAAVIEAEGSISTQTTARKKDGHLVITPAIRITNSDDGINNEILRICTVLGVSASIRRRPENHVAMIRIDGMKSVDLLLTHIEPYLRSAKAHNATVLREFISLRKAKSMGSFKDNPYTRNELELICSLRVHPCAIPLMELLKYPNVVN